MILYGTGAILRHEYGGCLEWMVTALAVTRVGGICCFSFHVDFVPSLAEAAKDVAEFVRYAKTAPDG